MYADYAYYQGTYHGVALTEEQWPAAAREADAWIDRLTLGRWTMLCAMPAVPWRRWSGGIRVP